MTLHCDAALKKKISSVFRAVLVVCAVSQRLIFGLKEGVTVDMLHEWEKNGAGPVYSDIRKIPFITPRPARVCNNVCIADFCLPVQSGQLCTS